MSEHRHGAGTAPGWGPSSAGGGRRKTAIYAAFLGVAVTLALVGAAAGIFAIKQRGAASAAAATSERGVTVPSVAASIPTAAGATPLTPDAPSLVVPVVSASPSASGSGAKAPAHGPLKSPTSKPTEAPKEPRKSPLPPAAANNPLLL